MSYLLALDQGTSSSRAIVFDARGTVVAMAQRELTQHYPQPGWVEHDPMEIWQTQLDTAREALQRAGLKATEVAGLGITNQRETFVLWDRRSGAPLHRAIVWQDRRGESLCAGLRAQKLGPLFQHHTGLLIDAYFSASKLQWLLDALPGARERAAAGELAFGTIDSWLLWKLTNGAVHATDQSNASRTLLFDIHENRWDDKLLGIFKVPRELLPEVHPSAWDYGQTAAEHFGAPIFIGGLAGDQQSALFGQACFEPGMAKNTYGTGCFMLMNTGAQGRASAHGLLTTATAQATRVPEYALEGAVFIGGAVVQWLRDGLGIISASSEVEALAASVPDAGGVVLVPAFTGLGAPYWNGEARGTITGLTRGSTRAHIARAAVESIAYQSTALLGAMSADARAAGSAPLAELRVDGGASANDALMQFQADLLGIAVVRPKVIETTALGAAQLAGLTVGVYKSHDEIAAHWQAAARFEPRMSRDEAATRMAAWEKAVRQTVAA
ncbi:MAG: glycerol kinase GlpK [Paucibacter sp.]|nr:glycerol kinase GlpK [Roseateles sp.]